GQVAAEQVLHQETAEGVANEDGLALERLELPGDVLGDFGYAVAGHGGGLAAGGLGGRGIPGPTGGGRFVAAGAEKLQPVVPRLGVEPEAVDKDDRILGGIVR